jgi:hypothetical protein
VSLSTVVFSLLILQQMLTQQQAEVQASAKAQALLVKNRMESELKANILPLELLRICFSCLSQGPHLRKLRVPKGSAIDRNLRFWTSGLCIVRFSGHRHNECAARAGLRAAFRH